MHGTRKQFQNACTFLKYDKTETVKCLLKNMYSIYKKKPTSTGYSYQFEKQVSFFGCNSGVIIDLLRLITPKNVSERYEWHIDLNKVLFSLDNNVLMINLKPNSTNKNLSLYEIANVWGVSDCGWTPIMLHLKGVIIDDCSGMINPNNFYRNLEEIDDPIFSMLYLDGSVKNGDLVGKWTAPRPSPTNSCLLWPDTFEYFIEARKSINFSTEHKY